METRFLPVTSEDMRARGWDAPDFVFVSGDAYVDHPSFGTAILSRVLEKAGYRVAILAQPAWRTLDDFTRFGRPRLGFLVSSGVIDSMVNHYTAAKKPRGEDAYAPGGKAGMRPDRCTIVYCNQIRAAYDEVPIVIGGVEASLRRMAHYDYWDDKVRHGILLDSQADLLLYGMGEKTILDAAKWLEQGAPREALPGIRGACWLSKDPVPGYEELPSFEEVATSKADYARAFFRQMQEQDAVIGVPLMQRHGKRYVMQNPPAPPLSRPELDAAYALSFERAWHPSYDAQGGVPALQEVQFSIAATRGCFGGCNFCALTYHQGRVVTSRSPQSILMEAQKITHLPGFKGYIHDVGGPTANFRRPACDKQLKRGACKNRQCLYPHPCKHLVVDHNEFVTILRSLREVPGVKKVFIRSGLRYDYLLADARSDVLREICSHHVSGQLKVAPEHVNQRVLDCMGKPGRDVYDRFVQKYKDTNRFLGLTQYLVPYLMSSHPGSDLHAAIELAEYLRDTGHTPEQVQDFYPTPGTLSTAMFYTGLDPRTMQPVHVARTAHEKALQRALLQYKNPKNHALVCEALRLAEREDLIGFDAKCLVRPRPMVNAKADAAPGARRPAPKAAGRPSVSRYSAQSTSPKPAGPAKPAKRPEKPGRIGTKPPSVGLKNTKPRL